MSLYFKEEGVLATHPLSCHPQRVLASEKMRESERKSRDKNTRLIPKAFLIPMNESLQSLVSGIYANLQIQITKISKENHYYIGTNLEEVKKSTKKVSRSS